MTEQFTHPNYDLIDNDRIVRKTGVPPPTMEDTQEVLQEIGRYVQAKLLNDMGFEALAIPDDEQAASTSVLASSDWQTSERLLIIIQRRGGPHGNIQSFSLSRSGAIKRLHVSLH